VEDLTRPATHIYRLLKWGRTLARHGALRGIERNPNTPAPVRRLVPWGVFGFVLCVASGSLFVGGLWANIAVHPYDVLIVNRFLQTKLIFIGLAGLNLLVFNLTGVSRAVDQIGPGEDAPPMAKAIAAASLFLWFGVIYVGRLIVWGNLSI